MTTKYITSYVAAGYTLSAAYDTLDITSTGGVGGRGVYSNHVSTVVNDGRIVGSSDGVYLRAGGTVLNGSVSDTAATIQGRIRTQFGSLTVVNYGVITGAVSVYKGAVTNEGTISGTVSGNGVLVNGSATDASAVIGGALYVSGTGLNYGSILGQVRSNGSFANSGTVAGGLYVQSGRVANGGLDDLTALIEGGLRTGFEARSSITNYGTIEGATETFGVNLEGGDHLVNGARTDTTALIQASRYGVDIFGGYLTNFGSVVGGASSGVQAYDGVIANGAGARSIALIEGRNGVYGEARSNVEVINAGTIEGSARKGVGVELENFGEIFNGSTANHTALIEGHSGVILSTAQRCVNDATIKGEGKTGGFGVEMAGGYLANGGAGYRQDLISGYTGVDVTGPNGTVVNFGTIAGGAGGAAVLGSASDVLVVENGCRFIGAVAGGGGTLDLDTGRGAFTGLMGDDAMVIKGIMPPATFSAFGTLEIGQYAHFKLLGAGSVAAGQAVSVAGTLALGGPLGANVTNAGLIETTGAAVLTLGGRIDNTGVIAADGGTIVVNGRLSGHGLVTIDAATLELRRASDQDVTFTGKTGMLVLADSQGYAGTIAHFSYTGGTSLDLEDIAFVGRKQASYAGTAAGGVLTVSDGTHTARIAFTGDYRAAQFICSSDGHGGVMVVDPKALASPGAGPPPTPAAPSVHRLVAAAAGLTSHAASPLHVGGLDTTRAPLIAAPKPAVG